MIDVREAVQTALAFVHQVMPDPRSNSILLEEIELSEGESEWAVTISVPTPYKPSLSAVMAAVGTPDRDYKVLRIDAETGKVKSLKIRKV
jgi:hypothetical protein